MSEITNLPDHVAIILDGNRRWARGKELQDEDGHRKGIETLVLIAKAAANFNIKYFDSEKDSINCVVSKQKDSNVELIMIKPNVVYGKDFVEKIIEEGEKTENNLESKHSKLIKIKNCTDKNCFGEFEKFSYGENFKRL